MTKLNKIIKILLVVFCCIFFIDVSASECTEKDIEELKILANKITFSREFISDSENKEEQYYGFILSGYNLNKNLILRFPNGLDFYSEKTSEEIGYFDNGNYLTVDVYASQNHVCETIKVTTLNIEFPQYNLYSERPECKNKKLDICQKWYDSSKLTEEEFKKIINESNKFTTENKKNNTVIDFILNNLYTFIGIALIIFITSTIIIVKKNKNKVKIDL